MRTLDFSSWETLLSTLLGLALITLIGVGLRLVVLQTVQQRRERENRQINERLRTLIAAYKTLGGSFTGELAVSPVHLRDLRGDDPDMASSSDRSRRIRDAVESALSDILLLGTEEQVRLAAEAATALAEGRPARTHELVVSLRSFIRKVLDLDAVPANVSIPNQGPTRPSGGRGSGKDDGGKDRGRAEGGAGGRAGLGAVGGGGLGGSSGSGLASHDEDDADPLRK